MADDGVKHVRAVSSRRRSLTYNLLDLIDAVFASAAVEVVSIKRRFFLFLCFTLLTPYNGPIKNFIDVGELLDGVEPIAGDRQRFVGAPKQLSCDRLVI